MFKFVVFLNSRIFLIVYLDFEEEWRSLWPEACLAVSQGPSDSSLKHRRLYEFRLT